MQLNKSLNHRWAEAGGYFWKSPSPAPSSEQGQHEQVAQSHLPLSFEYLQGWRHHNFDEQLVLVCVHPHSEEVFSCVEVEFPVFQFVTIDYCSVTGQNWEEPGTVAFTSTIWYILKDKRPFTAWTTYLVFKQQKN